MNRFIRYRIIILLWIATIAGQFGCAHSIPGKSSTKPPSLSAEVNAELRTIGIVSGRYKPECGLSFSPVRPSERATIGVVAGPLQGAIVGVLVSLKATGNDPLAILTLPIYVGIGAVVGAFMGIPKSKAVEAEAAIKNAIDELNVQETMRESVMTVALERTRYQFVVIEDQGPTAMNDEPIYSSPGDKRIDAILETNVQSYGLRSEKEINPLLQLFINVSVRLIRVTDGAVLYSKNFRRESMGREFIDWGANSAEEFKDTAHFYSYSLAKQIVRDLFN